jgi:mxaJ protein
MSSHFHDTVLSRRSWLKWAAASAAALPLAARAECPCGDDAGPPAPAESPAPAGTLRICADPNNLPFSNRAKEGFEDRLAALVAQDLGLKLEYQWLPQRLGFYRTAFKTFQVNLVMAAPVGFDMALATQPYYRSTYVFVTRKSATPIRSFDDPSLKSAKIGVTLTGGVNTPPTHALAKRNIIDNVTGFSAFDESQGKPGEKIIAAVARGEIDVAIAWGPQAAWFARQQPVELSVTPVTPEEDTIGSVKLPFTYGICMAVKRPDKALRDKIKQIIAKRRNAIDRILDDYAVPRLPLQDRSAGTGFDSKEKDGK